MSYTFKVAEDKVPAPVIRRNSYGGEPANKNVAECFVRTKPYQDAKITEIVQSSSFGPPSQPAFFSAETKKRKADEADPEGEKAENAVEGPQRQVVRVSFGNGLIGAVVGAYNNHHNLVLRPEDFWIAVLVQFSSFVCANSEKLRDQFVDFQGKKELVLTFGGEMRSFDFRAFALLITDKIQENLKDDTVRDWIMPNFSTTTDNDRVVCSVVMMATLQKFFAYKCRLMCGIPNVTLLGTPEDFLALLRKVDRLAEFEQLKEWHAMLRPIFVELVEASKKNPSQDFWSKICHYQAGGSGPSYLSGWITAFCCFSEKGEWQVGSLQEGGDEEGKKYPRIDTEDIPCGLVSVPVVVDDNGTEYKATMLAGSFLGEVVDEVTLAPRPDWMIGI